MDSILWTDETKMKVFGADGLKTVWCHIGEQYKEKCIVPKVTKGFPSVLKWVCMSPAGVGH